MEDAGIEKKAAEAELYMEFKPESKKRRILVLDGTLIFATTVLNELVTLNTWSRTRY